MSPLFLFLYNPIPKEQYRNERRTRRRHPRWRMGAPVRAGRPDHPAERVRRHGREGRRSRGVRRRRDRPGEGNPDAYPAEFIRDVAKSSVDDPLNARYTPFDGKPAFLQAAANWYRNVHGVELDWRSQLFAVEGAVDGLAGLFAILIDRGDAVAFADPYYPSYHCMSVMHGAEEILLPARAELGWLPDLDAVDESVWRRLLC